MAVKTKAKQAPVQEVKRRGRPPGSKNRTSNGSNGASGKTGPKTGISLSALVYSFQNGDQATKADVLKRYPNASLAVLTQSANDILGMLDFIPARKLENILRGNAAPSASVDVEEQDEVEVPVKRGPGRPPKNAAPAKVKKAPAVIEEDDEEEEEEETPAPRKRGRPPGSKNKATIVKGKAKPVKAAKAKKSRVVEEDDDEDDIDSLLESADDEEEEDDSDEEDDEEEEDED